MAMAARTRAEWRYHSRSAADGAIGFLAASFLLGLLAMLWWRDAAAIVGGACVFPAALLLAFTAYTMGRGSGWEGLWTVRVFREVDDVRRRVEAALANAGRGAVLAPDQKPSRWLRVMGPPKGAPLELPDGTLVWFLPSTREGPARPPVTRIVLHTPARLDPVELEFLKGTVLASMAPAYAAPME